MDKSVYLYIVWSSLIICKFQVYTDLIPYPKFSLGILFHFHILRYLKRRNSV